jgi:hypothetical protein
MNVWLDFSNTKRCEAQGHTYFVGDCDWGFAVWSHNAECLPIDGRAQHGDDWHNKAGVARAKELLANGEDGVRWNQNLVDPQGNSLGGLGGKRPDVQYLKDGKVFIEEFQSNGQSDRYMEEMEEIYRDLLGMFFGGYKWIPHP